jgi:ferrochelatase
MTASAVVLFNLGGPDRPESVAPFLFNLFSDPAIIGAPGVVRWPLAKLIAARRAPVARAIYAKLGGGSPIRANTEAQARALEAELSRRRPEETWRVVVAMRHWHPFTAEAVEAVRVIGPRRILLLPLYPQFSTTTTASSEHAWRKAARAAGLTAPTRYVCCWPRQAGFVAAIARAVREAAAGLGGRRHRILFSAHGLPKKVVARGDPYQWQVEETASAIARAIGDAEADWAVCYQSRVGPLEWIGPATDAEIRRAGREGVALVVVPIAFVSEHSETLVELDIEYRKLAEECGVPAYVRVSTVGVDSAFIAGLAETALAAIESDTPRCSAEGRRVCPIEFGRCALAA